jgi:hypothetical protein
MTTLTFSLLMGLLAEAEAPASPVSNALNPDIGVNFLGGYRRSTHQNEALSGALSDGLHFEEAELQFSADVDPYLKASALFALAPEDGEFVFEPEEVYFETISLPSVTLRAGKFKSAISRHNEFHTHAYPFLDAPLIEEALFGGEGLNDVGLSAAVLLPISWFSEVTAQVFAATNDTSFGSPGMNDSLEVVRFKNLWELNDDTTLEWNLGGGAGANQWGGTTWVGTTSLTGKWRPSVLGKYQSLLLHAEYLFGTCEGRVEDSEMGGLAAWAQYQLAQRWWLQVRGEWLGVPSLRSEPNQRKQSLLVAFSPSEFSGFRFQYDHLDAAGALDTDHRLSLQWNISIGAHPAHAY